MHKVEITKPVEASAETVWSVLSDFGGFLNWAKFDQAEIRIEGKGLGMVRHLKTPIGGIGEQLTSLDHDTRQIGYKVTYGEPIGMKTYEALISVIDQTDGICEVHWQGHFEPVDAMATEQVRAALSSSYEGMHQALASYSINIS